jgi:hypothetical protein
MTNSSSFPLTGGVTTSIKVHMQTLPLDRKSPGQSTRAKSARATPARPRDAAASPAVERDKAGNLAAKFAELWAARGSRMGALARRLEELGRGLLRVGSEPLMYSAGLGARLAAQLARLLRASRELMEMGHVPPARRDQDARTPMRSHPRKKHRLSALHRLCARHERGRVGRTRAARTASMPRAARRLIERPVRSTSPSASLPRFASARVDLPR